MPIIDPGELNEAAAPIGQRAIDRSINDWECFTETHEMQLRLARPGGEETRAAEMLRLSRNILDALFQYREFIGS